MYLYFIAFLMLLNYVKVLSRINRYMFGLITMLLTTLGATGMGSMLKIVGGLVQSISDEREAKAKREMASLFSGGVKVTSSTLG